MTTNKMKNETFLQIKIAFLSKKNVTPSDDLNANTLFSIISASDVLLEFERIELKHPESRRTRFRILNVLIAHKGSVTLTEISKRVFRSKYNTARVIDKLIREGLAKRKTIDGNRRAKNITITKKVIAFIKETMPNRLKMSNEVMACLTRNHVVSLTGLFKKLKKHLFNIIAIKDPDFRNGVEIC